MKKRKKPRKSAGLIPGIIFPDIHAPYHDRRAVALILQVAADLKPKYLRLLGDVADCYSVSTYSKDPSRIATLDQELDGVNALMDQLDALGATDKEYCGGNHEYRLDRYLASRAPELSNLVKIDEILRLKERGWKYIPYKESTTLGKVHFTHDVGTSTRYSVYKCLDTFVHSNVTGHTHRMAYIVEGDALGQAKLSAQFGWLGDVDKVDYMHRINANKNWALGFGVMYVDALSHLVYIVPVPIIRHQGKYTCMVNGKLYVG